MTSQDNQRMCLAELARRWRLDADRIVALAIDGALPLWISLTDVFLHTPPKQTSEAKKRKSALRKERFERVEVRPASEVLAQIQGRCDRMLIAAELPCINEKGKPVVITNSVGEEWGETSMIGLQPATLFAHRKDVLAYERKNKIVQPTVDLEHHASQPSNNSPSTVVSPLGHPWFAPELHVAITCWQTLFGEASSTGTNIGKQDILSWLQQHQPELSQATMARIAQVVSPVRDNNRSSFRQKK